MARAYGSSAHLLMKRAESALRPISNTGIDALDIDMVETLLIVRT